MSKTARLSLWQYCAMEGIAAFACTIFQMGIFFWAKERHGFTPTQCLLLGALQGLAYMLSAKFGGARAAQIGYDRVLQFAMIGTAVTTLSLWFVDWHWIPFVILGVFTATIGPFWPSLEAALLHAPSRLTTPQRLGLYNLTWAFTGSAGFFLCGFIVARQIDALIWLPGIIMAAQLLFFVGRGRARDEGEVNVAHDENFARPANTRRRFAHLHWLANSQAYFVMIAFNAIAPYIGEKLGLTAQGVIWLTCAYFFSRAISFVVLTRWEGWHYVQTWTHACLVLTPVCGGVMFFAPWPAAVLVACIVFGFVLALAYSGSLYYSMNVGDNKGEHGGLHEAIIGGGILLGPLVGAGGSAWNGTNGAAAVVSALAITVAIAGVPFINKINRAPGDPR